MMQRYHMMSGCPMVERLASRTALVATLIVSFGTLGNAQPCNPAIDGTYCATQTYKRPEVSTSSVRIMPTGSLGESLSAGQYDQPGKLGAITFSGDGSRCIGLLRRVNCN
jgi:hypothetical protein